MAGATSRRGRRCYRCLRTALSRGPFLCSPCQSNRRSSLRILVGACEGRCENVPRALEEVNFSIKLSDYFCTCGMQNHSIVLRTLLPILCPVGIDLMLHPILAIGNARKFGCLRKRTKVVTVFYHHHRQIIRLCLFLPQT